MKITQQKDRETNIALSTIDIDNFVQKIKTETKAQPVSSFREQLKYTLPDMHIDEADKPSKILPAAEFRKVEKVKQLKAYNGIVELTIGPLSGKAEVGMGAAANAARLHRLQRTHGENMDYLHPPRQLATRKA